MWRWGEKKIEKKLLTWAGMRVVTGFHGSFDMKPRYFFARLVDYHPQSVKISKRDNSRCRWALHWVAEHQTLKNNLHLLFWTAYRGETWQVPQS